MICCVIGSAILSLLAARLAALPVVGVWFARRDNFQFDASNWRLDSGCGSGGQA